MDFTKSIFKSENFLFWFLGIVYFFIGIFSVFWGDFWIDEGWYFGSSVLIAQGQVPYVDFFAHHSPLVYYFYSLPQALFGSSFIIGRLTSLVLMMAIFYLVYKTASNLLEKKWANLACFLLVINPYSIYYFTSFSYRAIEAFFMILFFFILSKKMKDEIKYPLSILALCLVVGTRYPIDFVSGLLGLYMIFLIWYFRKDRKMIIYCIATLFLSLGAIFLPFIIKNWDNFIFDTVGFPFIDTKWLADFGVMAKQDFLHKIFRLFYNFAGVCRNFFATVLLIFTGLFYWVRKAIKDKNIIFKFEKNGIALSAMAILILVNEIFLVVSSNTGDLFSFRNLVFPVAVILATYGLISIIKNENIAKQQLVVLPVIVAVLLGIFIQDSMFNSALKMKPNLDYYFSISEKIKDYTKPGDAVLTFTPVLAFQAGRNIVPGTIMEIYSYFPTWSDQECLKRGLINNNMIISGIESKKPAAIVLTDARFFSSQGASAIFNPYRENIVKSLEKNYYLAEKINSPAEIGQGNAYIYLRR